MDATRIGIAGFMGAGKSTCARFLSDAGGTSSGTARIIDADAEAKRLMQSDEGIKNKLVETFGPSVISRNAMVFQALGEAAFSSAENLRTLNTIVHPALVKRLKERTFLNADARLIFDAALIPLWHIEKWFDVLIWIRASFEKRYERLKNKTGLPAETILTRMELQQALFEEPKQPPWNIIENHGTREELECKLRSRKFFS
jgi:dephospho-CoA kinase